MNIISIILLCFISLSLHAWTDCTYTNAKNIQVQKTGVLVLFTDSQGSSRWKLVVRHGDSYSASFQSVIQQAIATNKPVMVRYESDNYDCSALDYGTLPIAIRM